MFYLLQAALTILKALGVMPELSMFLIFAVASFFMCAVYGVVFSNISYMKKDAEAALVRQNAEYLSAQISTLQNAEKMHQRFRHDMRHHLKIIAEYAKADDVSSILAYVREYSIEISETAVKQYSINSMINMILSVYAGKVKESCQKAKKENSYIEIYIRLDNDRLLIVCNNTCSDNLELADGLPVPKGIGISSILAVCQKYDGNLDYRVENGICSACAVLNL